ncbi:TIGR02452 family protein [Paenibacillus senegalimassiliensis]|uniref:TIGR02452 family protein n=1 Tax=Paenibacillus senegalimassiliensis TaxID=1737426 RepID=UPI00073F24F6|nr:TIGR02452 family protein [Paenibacillus senegalimassiliensis]
MERKEIAKHTVQIMEQGFYEYAGKQVDIEEAQRNSEQGSILVTPAEAEALLETYREATVAGEGSKPRQRVANIATVQAILELHQAGGQRVGVLNFASAKNPGGGFLNGAMAQEESLAASSGLYGSLLRHPTYYKANRANKSMMYTHHAIYSPEVVFFRDEHFELLAEPVTASVITLPAVNYGQVLRQGEDPEEAAKVMKERMRLALSLFAREGHRVLVLGAYGCGVFRNDSLRVAVWWKELLGTEGFGNYFDEIVYAVLDRSKQAACISAFEEVFAAG